MFEIGWSELFLVGVVALIVIGPKELPGMLRGIGAMLTKVRRMASDFRYQFDEAMREAELDELRKGVSSATDTISSVKSAFNPIETIRNEIKSAIDTPGQPTATGAVATAAAATAGTSADAPVASPTPPVAALDLPPPPVPAPVVLDAPAPAPVVGDQVGAAFAPAPAAPPAAPASTDGRAA